MVKAEHELGAWLFPGTPAAVPPPSLSQAQPRGRGLSCDPCFLSRYEHPPQHLFCVFPPRLFGLLSCILIRVNFSCFAPHSGSAEGRRGEGMRRRTGILPKGPVVHGFEPPLPGTLWGERVRGVARHPGSLGLEFMSSCSISQAALWCSTGWGSNVRPPVYAYLLAHLKVSVSSLRTVRL